MPSDLVIKLIERVVAVETQVKNLMVWQKWQMGLLALILSVIIANKFGH